MADRTPEQVREDLQKALRQKHDRIQTFGNTPPDLGTKVEHGSDLHPKVGGSPFNDPPLPNRKPYSSDFKSSINKK